MPWTAGTGRAPRWAREMGTGSTDRPQAVSKCRVAEPPIWLALVVICLAALIAYAPSFAVPFQFDDEARLKHNVAMQNGAVMDALSWLGDSRLIPSLTLLLNYRLGEFEPLGYHLV